MPTRRFSSYLPYLIAGTVLLLLAHGVVAQEAAAEGGAAPAESKTLFQTIWEGNALIKGVWLAIIGASVTMVTFIVQGLLTLQRKKVAPPPLVESLRQTVD